MRPHGMASTPAANDIAPAVLAIGRPDFPNVLIDTLRRQAGVGHCMVFALTRTGAASCLLDAGNIPIGSDLGAAYAGQFHESDPNRDALFEGEGSAPIMLPSFAPRMYGARYRKIFFNDSDIVDKYATAIWVGDICFYVISTASPPRAALATSSVRGFRPLRLRSAPALRVISSRRTPRRPTRTSPRCSQRARHSPR
ncbi:hypothetical protein ABIF99_003105 [Bradyrhizobium japonicum]|nr:hypothetical protein [Bradyrhizobium japonicum]MCP1862847.1 hypothetical protein [Bradyrhizobium japonicum]MCP1893701.1 hypothetical protein [Bradyrhizobium japonicum]MCW2326816.1 hypothetical protein [Bradyrhizobium japonicum]